MCVCHVCEGALQRLPDVGARNLSLVLCKKQDILITTELSLLLSWVSFEKDLCLEN